MSTPPTFDWMKEIQPQIKALDAIPLTGASPPFPWEELAAKLAQTFELQKVEIQPKEMGWRTKEQLFEGLGEQPFSLNFGIPSLKGIAMWVMPEQEIGSLETLLLTKETHPINFNDRSLSEAFYRFMAIEVLYNLTQIHFDKTLVPILMNKNEFPKQEAFCWDISITLLHQTFWGRLLISSELRKSWVEHFANLQKTSALTEKLTQAVEVLMQFEIGKVQLSYQELSELKVGDWIALDSFSLDPESLSGPVSLTINGKKAFVGQWSEGHVKILELPSHHEV